jgi:ribosome recycling factor
MANRRPLVVGRQAFLLQARMLTTLNVQARSIYRYQ